MHTDIKNESQPGMQLLTAHRSRPAYVELHARSAFSFLRGAATPEELITVCAELKMPAMALLDNDGLYGAARFHLAGKKLKVKAHIGAELTVSDFKSQVTSSKSQSRRQPTECQIPNSTFQTPNSVVTLPLLVRNRTGYQNLCRLITLMKLRVPKHAKPGQCAVTPDELAAHAEGLICLTGPCDGPLGEALSPSSIMNSLGAGVARARGGQRPPLNSPDAFTQAQRNAEWLIDVFGKGNVYAELQRHFNRDEEAWNHAVIEIARR